MNMNDDFEIRVVVDTHTQSWLDSPIPGVRRRLLDRVGAEVARATSIVSYEPGSCFSSHIHTGGEEFIVLEGIFQDEHGDYPAGWYVRNPPQSSHTPSSEPGCVIFVKLWQFDLQDRAQLRIDMNAVQWVDDPERDNVRVSILHEDTREKVQVERWTANSKVTVDTSGGAEILVLEGSFTEGADTLSVHSWVRLPIGSDFYAAVGDKSCKVWVKTNHLRYAEEERQRIPV